MCNRACLLGAFVCGDDIVNVLFARRSCVAIIVPPGFHLSMFHAIPLCIVKSGITSLMLDVTCAAHNLQSRISSSSVLSTWLPRSLTFSIHHFVQLRKGKELVALRATEIQEQKERYEIMVTHLKNVQTEVCLAHM